MSSNVYISNVDDYVAPSQACVNPIFSAPRQTNDKNKKEEDKKEDMVRTSSGNNGGGVAVSSRRRARRKRTELQTTMAADDDEAQTKKPLPTTNRNEIAKNPATTTTTLTNNNNSGKDDSPAAVVQASLADCLACSGCVTTTETVLLEEQHSLNVLRRELLLLPNKGTSDEKKVQENSTTTTSAPPLATHVMTLSPAAWADLFRHLGLPLDNDEENLTESQSLLLKYQQQFTHVVHSLLNIHWVLDGNLPLTWSLHEAADEFCQAHRRKEEQKSAANGALNNGDVSSLSASSSPSYEECKNQLWPSRALSKGQVQFRSPENGGTLITHDVPSRTGESSSSTTNNTAAQQPLLSASCPAVVCLVEKTAHKAVPHLATTASPMSLAGAWWKQQQQQQQQQQHDKTTNAAFQRIHHIAIMPCHDKKLEASRTDFQTTGADKNGKQHDVDISITTRECLDLLQEALDLKNQKNKDYGKDTLSLSDLIQKAPLALVSFDTEGGNWKNTAGMFLSTPSTTTAAPSESSSNNTKNSTSKATPSPFVSGSGGYADYIFRYACRELYGVHVEKDEVPWEAGSWNTNPSSNHGNSQAPPRSARMAAAMQRRNKDFFQAILYKRTVAGQTEQTYVIRKEGGDDKGSVSYEPVLRFALAYGMQTLQRMLKPFSNSSDDNSKNGHSQQSQNGDFDYVEAMACPSGCPNGGGQIISGNRKETPTETRTRLTQTRQFFSRPAVAADVATKIPVPIPVDERHTTYHVVPPMQLSMGAAAGVAVDDIQW